MGEFEVKAEFLFLSLSLSLIPISFLLVPLLLPLLPLLLLSLWLLSLSLLPSSLLSWWLLTSPLPLLSYFFYCPLWFSCCFFPCHCCQTPCCCWRGGAVSVVAVVTIAVVIFVPFVVFAFVFVDVVVVLPLLPSLLSLSLIRRCCCGFRCRLYRCFWCHCRWCCRGCCCHCYSKVAVDALMSLSLLLLSDVYSKFFLTPSNFRQFVWRTFGGFEKLSGKQLLPENSWTHKTSTNRIDQGGLSWGKYVEVSLTTANLPDTYLSTNELRSDANDTGT